ncbi:MAG: DUF5104 domain-containing protein [Ruminococcus flavefaciens]|nr:DUF5104 domain-containing protein [Ruminococcus flavefaciens]
MKKILYRIRDISASVIRHILALILLLAVWAMSACSSIEKLFSKDKTEYISPDNLAIQHQSKIMECFINRDPEPIKSLMSGFAVENNPDIDGQIVKAFDFLDGKIVSYDKPFPSACGAREQKAYGAETRHVITDKGTEYTIGFKGWYSYDKAPEKVGITAIYVSNETTVEQFKNQYKEKLTKYPLRNKSVGDQLDYFNIKYQTCIGYDE